jgi:hypothetical protein
LPEDEEAAGAEEGEAQQQHSAAVRSSSPARAGDCALS